MTDIVTTAAARGYHRKIAVARFDTVRARLPNLIFFSRSTNSAIHRVKELPS